MQELFVNASKATAARLARTGGLLIGLAAAGCGNEVAVDEGPPYVPGKSGGRADIPPGMADACPHLAEDPMVCVTMNNDSLVAFSVTSGQHCNLMPHGHYEDLQTTLGAQGSAIYLCGRDGMVRADLDTQARDVATWGCSTVTSYWDKLLFIGYKAPAQQAIWVYPVTADLSAFQPELSVEVDFVPNGIYATGGDVLYVTTNNPYPYEIDVGVVSAYELPSAELLRSFRLEGLEGFVRGFFVQEPEGALLVLTSESVNTRDYRLIAFDTLTGEQHSAVALSLPGFVGGLHCWGR